MMCVAEPSIVVPTTAYICDVNAPYDEETRCHGLGNIYGGYNGTLNVNNNAPKCLIHLLWQTHHCIINVTDGELLDSYIHANQFTDLCLRGQSTDCVSNTNINAS
eukprot:434147_1